jgi:hypothetical protein
MRVSLFAACSFMLLPFTALAQAEAPASAAPAAAPFARQLPGDHGPAGFKPGMHREAFRNASPEDRAAMRANAKAKFDALPAEKQNAIKARHAEHKATRVEKRTERREAFRNALPEQRQEMKANAKAKFDALPAERQQQIKNRQQLRQEHRATRGASGAAQ